VKLAVLVPVLISISVDVGGKAVTSVMTVE
jgi:hypothetical protein